MMKNRIFDLENGGVDLYTSKYGSRTEKTNKKVSKCKLKKYLFRKNQRETGKFCYSMTIAISPLVA